MKIYYNKCDNDKLKIFLKLLKNFLNKIYFEIFQLFLHEVK